MKNVGYVYILTNPLFKENIIKIGSTQDVKRRIKQLGRGTEAPCPFECYVAYEVQDYEEVEMLMHKIYRSVERNTDKVHKTKEFYSIAPYLADEVLGSVVKLLNGKKIQIDNSDVYTPLQKKSLEQKEKRQIATRFKFANHNIPVGAELVFTKNKRRKCIVTSNNKVLYKNKEYSLSGLTIKLMQEMQYSGTHYNGYAYWTYNNILLTEYSKNKINV